MRKQEVFESPAAGWRVWINSISLARHFKSEGELLLSRIQAALFPIVLSYLWPLFPYVLCAAALGGGTGGTWELPAWVSTGIQDPAAVWHRSTSSATPCELLQGQKKLIPNPFFGFSFAHLLTTAKDIVRGGGGGGWAMTSTFWEQDSTGLV